jgi:ubiquinone/menaquinone biosynthesis C-methylase UbiE
VRLRPEHPFARRWNHNTHYYPILRAGIPTGAVRVLDIGCGDGTLCRFLEAPGRCVVGVDPDCSVLPDSEREVRFAAASAESLPFADDAFDAVTMSMVLHHVDEVQSLAEGRRVLRPGGVLVVLGIARSLGPRDVLHELRDIAAHRAHRRSKTAWEPATVKVDPRATWQQTEATLRHELPGSSYRRLPMWRYLATWECPPA